jgi:hypothetical protein
MSETSLSSGDFAQLEPIEAAANSKAGPRTDRR